MGAVLALPSPPPHPTPELTRGNRKSPFHEFTTELTSKVNSHYRSRSQWLQLPNPTACRRIKGGPAGLAPDFAWYDQSTRWSTTLHQKSNYLRPINFTSSCGSNFVMPPIKIWGARNPRTPPRGWRCEIYVSTHFLIQNKPYMWL